MFQPSPGKLVKCQLPVMNILLAMKIQSTVPCYHCHHRPHFREVSNKHCEVTFFNTTWTLLPIIILWLYSRIEKRLDATSVMLCWDSGTKPLFFIFTDLFSSFTYKNHADFTKDFKCMQLGKIWTFRCCTCGHEARYLSPKLGESMLWRRFLLTRMWLPRHGRVTHAPELPARLKEPLVNPVQLPVELPALEVKGLQLAPEVADQLRPHWGGPLLDQQPPVDKAGSLVLENNFNNNVEAGGSLLVSRGGGIDIGHI